MYSYVKFLHTRNKNISGLRRATYQHHLFVFPKDHTGSSTEGLVRTEYQADLPQSQFAFQVLIGPHELPSIPKKKYQDSVITTSIF